MEIRKDDTSHITQLGSRTTEYTYVEPTAEVLETFPNQFPERDYVTEFVFNEFTSLCPKTGQPDFATISVRYIPDKLCIETKSLKLYYLAYRQHGSFMETITNQIFEDIKNTCDPRYLRVESFFNARGGTVINVLVETEDLEAYVRKKT